MRTGLAVGQYGSFASRQAVIEVARGAEALGFDSLWTGDRILDPGGSTGPLRGHLGRPDTGADADVPRPADGALRRRGGDRTRAARARARSTRRGTPPVLLARTLTTLDVLSDGPARRRFGLGLVAGRVRGGRRAVRGQGRAARRGHRRAGADLGRRRRRAPRRVRLRPGLVDRAQAGPASRARRSTWADYSPGALERVGRRADGWLGAGLPMPFLPTCGRRSRDRRRARRPRPGRAPMVLRLNPEITDARRGRTTSRARGTVAQIRRVRPAAMRPGPTRCSLDLHLTTSTVD